MTDAIHNVLVDEETPSTDNEKNHNVWARLPLPKTSNRKVAKALAEHVGAKDTNEFYAPRNQAKSRKFLERLRQVQAERANYTSTNVWAEMPVPKRSKRSPHKK
jgi:hypothetical protein